MYKKENTETVVTILVTRDTYYTLSTYVLYTWLIFDVHQNRDVTHSVFLYIILWVRISKYITMLKLETHGGRNINDFLSWCYKRIPLTWTWWSCRSPDGKKIKIISTRKCTSRIFVNPCVPVWCWPMSKRECFMCELIKVKSLTVS